MRLLIFYKSLENCRATTTVEKWFKLFSLSNPSAEASVYEKANIATA